MEQLKHECGIAMIRLRKPLSYFKEKYGSYTYALDRLYLLMEKQHNRGQEAAGVGVVKNNALPGNEYIFRERALGTGAIDEIFGNIAKVVPRHVNNLDVEYVESTVPFMGEVYMGHLRYSTTGRSGLEYTHPFLLRNNWRSRTLMLCGNFNMTNVDEIFEQILSTGQHPMLYGDTVLLLEQLGNALDKENHRIYRQYRNELRDLDLARRIEDELDVANVLSAASSWDGGYAIVGAVGSGDAFVLRDPNGIRPAFYYLDDEIVVAASERPVIQTVFNVTVDKVNELAPGCALIIDGKGKNVRTQRILPASDNRRCSFERVYFSRGSDVDIYRERKALGANIVPALLDMIDGRFDTTVFSFIPNTAEVAFMGMSQELTRALDRRRMDEIWQLHSKGTLTDDKLYDILRCKVRVEKIAIKDIKLRTFIAEGSSRNDLAAHVYDVTYGSIRPGIDSIVIIDDSIVRGTTLRQSILRILDRLQPVRIIIVSSAPQVRYPDYYGIDMPNLSELAAFRAAVSLLHKTNRADVLDDVYGKCISGSKVNEVKAIYEPFTDEEISAEMARQLRPAEINAKVDILFQTLDGLHRAIPSCPGDWYFSGDYPTPGGTRMVNRAFVKYYESLSKPV